MPRPGLRRRETPVLARHLVVGLLLEAGLSALQHLGRGVDGDLTEITRGHGRNRCDRQSKSYTHGREFPFDEVQGGAFTVDPLATLDAGTLSQRKPRVNRVAPTNDRVAG